MEKKNKIKFILAIIVSILICCFIIYSCDKKEYYMETVIENEMTYHQFDSLCIKDNISLNFEDWDSVFFVRDSSKFTLNQFMYRTQKNDTTTIYTAIPNTNTVFLSKRIEYEIKK